MNTKAEKAAMHVMMILADNTPHGPTEYAKCLKVVTGAIASYFRDPSVPVSELEALRKQRDAALKLADKWERDDYGTLLSDFSNELRAIFEPKEGKGDE